MIVAAGGEYPRCYPRDTRRMRLIIWRIASWVVPNSFARITCGARTIWAVNCSCLARTLL